jgi:hypothetical protein
MSTVDDGMRRAVLRRLAALDQAAEQTNAGGTPAPLARAELQRLADGWRLLLEVHTADEDGRCRACPGRLRKRRWPCKVWLLAHQHLIGGGTPPAPQQRGGLLGLFRRGGRHSKHANGAPVQGVRTPPLPMAARRTMALPPEVPSEMTVELPVLRHALPPAPSYTPITPASPPPAIASSGPFAIVDDPTWPAPSEYMDRPDAPALASLDPIGAFGGVLPAPPPAPQEPAAPPTEPLEDTMIVAEMLPSRFELLGEPDAETEEMRRVLEDYWQGSTAG